SPASTATVGSGVTCAGRALQAARASPTATTTTNTGNIRRAIAVIVLLCTEGYVDYYESHDSRVPRAHQRRKMQPASDLRRRSARREHQTGKPSARSIGDRCGLARQTRS